jgi:hypothetical protein
LIRWLLPILLKSFMKRAQNKMNQQYEQQDHQSKKEGEINVTSDPKTKSSGEKGQLGDYVDFEDIKDNDTK